MRRRSLLGLGFVGLLSGCASDEIGGLCLSPSEVSASPSGDPSPINIQPVDVAYSSDDYLTSGQLAVSPDGALVAANQSRARFELKLESAFGTVIWDAATGKVVRRLENQRDGALAWHPGGEWLAVGDTYNPAIQVIDREGELAWELRGHRAALAGPYVVDMAFSPDGELLASAGTDGTVRIWGVRRDQCRPAQVLNMPEPHSVSFSPDGDRLAVAAKDGCAIWDVHRGSRERPLQEIPSPVAGVAYGPDGILVVITSDPGATYLVSDQQVNAGPELLLETPSRVAVSSDGKIAICAVGRPEVMLWDPVTQVSLFAPAPPESVGRLAWAPDGQTLYGTSLKYGVLCWSADALRQFDLP
ncbi:MAG: hypothetical protein Q4D79_11880 [Propionibacteriaceae bacterium]|nr:hypothetical protein [Propionibacteriaceae bacterium]